ncbi:MAG: hypothetical protein HW391_2131, partial [Chloroflexi bacterium]|nr:hypothetical protein [Chloroflexota bacterium]
QDLGFVLVIILILVIIWRGPKTIPQIGAMLGRGIKSARNEAKDIRAGSDPKEPPAS